jgi:hypothetical protein
MFDGINIVVSRVHPTSHLFSYRMDSLNMLGQQIFFPFLDLGQAFISNAYRHGQKYYCQRDSKGHMPKAGLQMKICRP